MEVRCSNPDAVHEQPDATDIVVSAVGVAVAQAASTANAWQSAASQQQLASVRAPE